ncbi:MAG: hypothetical protein ACRDTA_30040 [Pseudonocardiaceae bacterium]
MTWGLTWDVLGGTVLLGLGMLLGTSWTTLTLKPKLRRQAEERRRLNEEWSALRTARRQRSESSQGASPQAERDWYIARPVAEDLRDDD